MRPHRRQPTRLLHPWDSPGKNTGVGCHFLLQCMKVKLLSCVRPSVIPWTAAYQAPSSMGFSRQEYWSGIPLPSPKEKSIAMQIAFGDCWNSCSLYMDTCLEWWRTLVWGTSAPQTNNIILDEHWSKSAWNQSCEPMRKMVCSKEICFLKSPLILEQRLS